MPASEEIYRTANSAQERFAFFFLAAAGGSIAFALARVEDQPPALWVCVAGLAVVLWGASFYFGSVQLLERTAILLLNFQREKVADGTEPQIVGKSPEEVKGVLTKMDARAEGRQKWSSRYGRLQFWLFFTGSAVLVLAYVLKVMATCWS